MEDGFGLWDVIISTFWFMLLISWIWLVIAIFGDIFRDRGLGGGKKAMWTVFLIFLPWLGAVVYLIARGSSMNERTREVAQANEARMRAYVQDAAGSTSVADQLRELAELRDSSVITPEEYEQGKRKILS